MWLPLQSVTLLPILTNGWIVLSSRMKQLSPGGESDRYEQRGAHVAYETISAAFICVVLGRTSAVHLRVAHGDEHPMWSGGYPETTDPASTSGRPSKVSPRRYSASTVKPRLRDGCRA